MKWQAGLLAAAVAVALGIGGGYWWGTRTQSAGSVQVAADAVNPAPTNAKAERKILYYRNPMGLPDTSPVPKKDPMGMDYVAVYDGDEPDTGSNQIKISVDKVQKLGVRSEPASMRSLDKVVKAVGRIEVDERRVFAIAPKFEGWVEQLFVNATGQPVSKGQPLFEVYSPELVSAQREYAIATEAVKALKNAGEEPQASMKRLADSSLARLKNWDISEEQVRALADSGEARRTLTFRSPVSGIVMEKKAVQGMRFMPGDSLYQVADLSSVWVIADVYRTGHRSGQDRQQGQGQHQCLSRQELRRHDHLRLSDAEARDANGSGAAGDRQSSPAAQAGDVRAGRAARRRQGEGADGAEFGCHRQRHAPASSWSNSRKVASSHAK